MINSIRIVVVAFLLLFASSSVAAKIDVSKLNKVTSFVTSGGDASTFKRDPQKIFGIGDTIFIVTTVTWEPLGSSAGRHKAKWRWFANGSLISEIELKPNFKPTPYELWAKMPASALGSGSHRVELLIDDQLYDTQVFVVQAATSGGA